MGRKKLPRKLTKEQRKSLLAFFVENSTEKGEFDEQNIKRDKVGRPTKMTKDTLRKLEQAFKIGCTKAEACEFAGIHIDTLNKFEHKYPEFIELEGAWGDNNIFAARALISKALIADKSVPDAWQYLRAKRKSEFAEQKIVRTDGITIEELEQAARAGVEADDDLK